MLKLISKKQKGGKLINKEPENLVVSYLKGLKTKLNPNNWGVSDYNNYGSYDKAFDAARKAAEKEFLWNGERYNTKTQLTPKQQMQKYGIPDDQVTGHSFIRDRWSKNVTPDPGSISATGAAGIPLTSTITGALGLVMGESGKKARYDTMGFNLNDQAFNNSLKNIPSSFIKEKMKLPAYKGMTEEQIRDNYINHRKQVKKYGSQTEDIYQLYLGKPQQYNSVEVSDYKPLLNKDKKDFYYSLPKLSQDSALIKKLYDNINNKNYKLKDPDNPNVGDIVGRGKKNVNAMLPSLGTATVGMGQDEKGRYISYYDDWDVTITGGSGSGGKDSTMGIGKPLSIYDRVYIDKDGYPIKQKSKLISNNKIK